MVLCRGHGLLCRRSCSCEKRRDVRFLARPRVPRTPDVYSRVRHRHEVAQARRGSPLSLVSDPQPASQTPRSATGPAYLGGRASCLSSSGEGDTAKPARGALDRAHALQAGAMPCRYQGLRACTSAEHQAAQEHDDLVQPRDLLFEARQFPASRGRNTTCSNGYSRHARATVGSARPARRHTAMLQRR
jgi:hypothetical protein